MAANIKTYSYKKDKNKKVSKHFTVGEFRAHWNGVLQTDKVIINSDLVNKLEKFFTYGIDTIIIVDGNRTYECSVKLKGGGYDAHTRGLAVDICAYKDGKLVSPKHLACLAQLIGFTGIGIMETSLHIDVRTKATYNNGYWHGDETDKSKGNTDIPDFFKYANTTKAKLFGELEYYNEALFKIKANKKAKIYKEPKSSAKIKKTYAKNKKARVWAEKSKYYKVLSGWIKKTDCEVSK